MTDIVEELRQASLSQSDYRWEAAEEIERLRKDLSLAVFADNEYWQVLEKENERLRAALEKIVNGPRDADLDYLDLFVEVKMEARAALEGKHD